MRGLKSTTGLVWVVFYTLFCINYASADNEYMVEKGDSLSKIGMLLGVPWEEIQKANNLKNTVIHPKQVLIIPSAGKVYHNETPVKSQELVNNPPPSFVDREVVFGPAPVPAEPAQYAAPRTPVEHNPVPQRNFAGTSHSEALILPPIQGNSLARNSTIPKTEKPVTYMVRTGDTAWSISRNFGLTLRELQKANKMDNSKIYPGQVLSIPKKVVVASY